jgi:hypothetical protein
MPAIGSQGGPLWTQLAHRHLRRLVRTTHIDLLLFRAPAGATRYLPGWWQAVADAWRRLGTITSKMLPETTLAGRGPARPAPGAPAPRLTRKLVFILAGKEAAKYKTHEGRRALYQHEPAPVNWAKWGITAPPQPKPRWEEVFYTRLEPKQQSLLWLMRLGAVVTRDAAHRRFGVGDGSCDVCADAGLSPAPRDTLVHFFLECPRIQGFWDLVVGFLDGADDGGALRRPDAADLLCGWKTQRRRLPSPGVLTQLASWQVYRAKTEFAMDNVRAASQTIFARWLGALADRIRADFQATKKGRRTAFDRWWLSPPTRWISVEPGGAIRIHGCRAASQTGPAGPQFSVPLRPS